MRRFCISFFINIAPHPSFGLKNRRFTLHRRVGGQALDRLTTPTAPRQTPLFPNKLTKLNKFPLKPPQIGVGGAPALSYTKKWLSFKNEETTMGEHYRGQRPGWVLALLLSALSGLFCFFPNMFRSPISTSLLTRKPQ
jgi:hypothetical protein